MKKTLAQKSFWVTIVGGMLTGMGNGSVFGAAMMCLVGRGSFGDWGGIGHLAYNPYTFTGFVDWCMLIFGFSYVGILAISTIRHGALEAQH